MNAIDEAKLRKFSIVKETDSFKRFDGIVEFLKMVGKLKGEQYLLTVTEVEHRRLEAMNYLFEFLPEDVNRIDVSKLSRHTLPLVAERDVEGEGKAWGFEEFNDYWSSLEREITSTMLSLNENK